jgi:hypothetical protein
MSTFQPPPTWALPVIVDPNSKEGVFNPIWLRWFLELSENLTGTGAPSTISVGSATGLTATNVLLGTASGGATAVVSDPELIYNATTNELETFKFKGALNGTVGVTTPATGIFTAISGPLTGTVGATTPASGAFSAITGPLNGTVGAVTPATGTFTNLAATTLLLGGRAVYPSAYGQLTINVTHAQTLNAAWTPVLNYDVSLATPQDVTQNLVAGTLTLAAVGTYLLTIAGAIGFTSNNAGRAFFARLFNTTDSVVAAGPIHIFVGRDIEGVNLGISMLFQATAPGKAIRLEIGNGNTFAACVIEDLAYAVHAV